MSSVALGCPSNQVASGVATACMMIMGRALRRRKLSVPHYCHNWRHWVTAVCDGRKTRTAPLHATSVECPDHLQAQTLRRGCHARSTIPGSEPGPDSVYPYCNAALHPHTFASFPQVLYAESASTLARSLSKGEPSGGSTSRTSMSHNVISSHLV